MRILLLKNFKYFLSFGFIQGGFWYEFYIYSEPLIANKIFINAKIHPAMINAPEAVLNIDIFKTLGRSFIPVSGNITAVSIFKNNPPVTKISLKRPTRTQMIKIKNDV